MAGESEQQPMTKESSALKKAEAHPEHARGGLGKLDATEGRERDQLFLWHFAQLAASFTLKALVPSWHVPQA
jgi:hypothetical protein